MYKLNEITHTHILTTKTFESISLESTAIRCFATLENFEILKRLPNLTHLELLNGKEAELKAFIASSVKVKILRLYNFQLADLEVLSEFEHLEYLILEWNSKATRLWNMQKMKQLKGLAILDLKRLENLNELETCPQLIELELSGGMNQKMNLESLEPIQSLANLEYLSLFNIWFKKYGLLPLNSVTSLKKLDVSNQFPTAEYAELSVALPNTACDRFSAYSQLKTPLADYDVMVTGKGKPFLNSARDRKKIEKYVRDFEKLRSNTLSKID